MLRYAIIFFVISLIAGGLGFSGTSSAFAGIAKICFYIFLAIAILWIIVGVTAFHAVF